MAAVAKNPKFAKKAGVPSSVGKEFLTADKGKKFNEGGAMKHSDMKMDKKVVKKDAPVKKMAAGGACKTAAKKEVKGHEKRMHSMAKGGMAKGGGCEIKGKTKGTMIKMKSGGAC